MRAALLALLALASSGVVVGVEMPEEADHERYEDETVLLQTDLTMQRADRLSSASAALKEAHSVDRVSKDKDHGAGKSSLGNNASDSDDSGGMIVTVRLKSQR
mmetsp:Transcript_42168/g.84975  ORF Transcript_42168/g.84975 Transcript_42168/m.84975 type:complete len:103 (-) Transcript_42168:91-399(-)